MSTKKKNREQQELRRRAPDLPKNNFLTFLPKRVLLEQKKKRFSEYYLFN